jgi:hypothetical protein
LQRWTPSMLAKSPFGDWLDPHKLVPVANSRLIPC